MPSVFETVHLLWKTLPPSVHSHCTDLVHRHPAQKFRWTESVSISQPYKHQEAEPLHCYRTFPYEAARMPKGASSSQTPSLSMGVSLTTPLASFGIGWCPHLSGRSQAATLSLNPWMLFCARTTTTSAVPHEMSSSLLEELQQLWPGDTATAS